MRSSRVVSSDTPPRSATTCPSSEVPEPKGTIGTRVSAAEVDDGNDLRGRAREDDDVRQRASVVRLAHGVLLANGLVRG